MFRLLSQIFISFLLANFDKNSTGGVGHVEHHVLVEIKTSDVTEKPEILPDKPVETDVLPDSEILQLLPWENDVWSHRCKNVSHIKGKIVIR
jgi:hypothetical protein